MALSCVSLPVLNFSTGFLFIFGVKAHPFSILRYTPFQATSLMDMNYYDQNPIVFHLILFVLMTDEKEVDLTIH